MTLFQSAGLKRKTGISHTAHRHANTAMYINTKTDGVNEEGAIKPKKIHPSFVSMF